MEPSTDALVGAALAGDRAAMRRLLAEVLAPVIERRLAHRLATGGAERAALRDHVQEVMVHLLERDAAVLRRWDPTRGRLEPYVAKVADNFVISRLRRRPPPTPIETVDDERAPTGTPEDGAAFARLVERLVRELSEADALLFRAIYLEELTPEEAAAALGISREAAHKRIQRLRARLTEMLSTAKARPT